MQFVLPVAMLVYPAWLGANQRDFSHVAIFALILSVALFFFGPKQKDVAGDPNKAMMALFSLILAVGLTGVGYGIGYFVFG